MKRTLRDILLNPGKNPGEWVFLSKDVPWELESECLVSIMDEVPPEEEDIDEAGYPEEVLNAHFMAALPTAEVGSIVFNAKAQKPDASDTDLLEAFLYYYDHDAYICLK
jgi:hypothetical protein